MLLQLKQWFEQQSERDQFLLKVMCVVIAFGAVYWLIWQPVNQAVTDQAKRLQQQESLATWVAQQQRKVRSLPANDSASRELEGNLVQVVNQTASQRQITLTRIQPRGEEVQIFIDEVEFNQLMSWLALIEERGAQILQIDVTEGNAPGMVKVRRLELGK
jgi:general secretion pathway protein M